MYCERLERELTDEECQKIQEQEQCEDCPCFIPFAMFMLEEQERQNFRGVR